MKDALTGSITMGALGPTRMAMTPAPPVGLAGPLGYTAMSAEITIPSLPSQACDYTQLSVLNRALVEP